MRELVEALKPFAEVADGIRRYLANEEPRNSYSVTVSLGSCRMARAALAAYSVPADVAEMVAKLNLGTVTQKPNEVDIDATDDLCQRAASLLERVAAERDEAWEKALEEAAKYVEDIANRYKEVWSSYSAKAKERLKLLSNAMLLYSVATAIRALKEQKHEAE